MLRRQLFAAAASTAAGAGLLNAAKTGSAVSSIETPDRVRLYHRDWGNGQPILFVHGWAMNCDMWQYQMLHLAEHGMRCIAFDRRGHGRSNDPGRGYDFDTLAGDLSSVIEQLNLRDVVLVGHSMGAAEVIRYLTRYGSGRVRKALLLAPSLPFIMKTDDNPHGIDKRALDSLRASFAVDFPKWLASAAHRRSSLLRHRRKQSNGESISASRLH